MRFTDHKTLFTDRIPLLSIRSIRRDRHMAYSDRYGAGVLDNPPDVRYSRCRNRPSLVGLTVGISVTVSVPFKEVRVVIVFT